MLTTPSIYRTIDLEFIFKYDFYFFINPENFYIFKIIAFKSHDEELKSLVQSIIQNGVKDKLTFFHSILKYGKTRLMYGTITFEQLLRQLDILYSIDGVDINQDSVYINPEYGNVITITTDELMKELKTHLTEVQQQELDNMVYQYRGKL